MMPIDALQFADYNPRQMPADMMDKLKRSLKENGFVQPVVINSHPERKNVIIGGHQRVAAARALEITEVPCIFIEKNPKAEKALNLALNKIDGQWVDDKLGGIIAELKGDDVLTGFSETETSKILDNMMSPFDLEDDEDEEELPDEPISKPGEIYELGQHRLICGDSTKPETYEKLLGGLKADMIFTDPPYNVNYHSRGGAAE